VLVRSLAWFGYGLNIQLRTNDPACLTQASSISDYQWPTALEHLTVSEGLHDDFGANAGRIAHCDCYSGRLHRDLLMGSQVH